MKMKVVLLTVIFNLLLCKAYCQNDAITLEGKWALNLCVNQGDTTFKLDQPEYCIKNINNPNDMDSLDLIYAINESYKTNQSTTLNFENQTYFHTTRYFTEDLIENKNRFVMLNGQLWLYQNETVNQLFSVWFIAENNELELIDSKGNITRWSKH